MDLRADGKLSVGALELFRRLTDVIYWLIVPVLMSLEAGRCHLHLHLLAGIARVAESTIAWTCSSRGLSLPLDHVSSGVLLHL